MSRPDRQRSAARDGRLAGRLALGLVFALLAVLALRQVGSLDAGFHLEAGESMLEGHGWPRTDPFSYTMADHRYVDTTWGYQVAVAMVHRMAGPAGLTVFHAALVLAAFGLTWATLRLEAVSDTAAAALILLGGLASELRFETRPELLSYVLLAGVIHLLWRHMLGRYAPLWLLPPMFLVWVNVHALFVLGSVAVACFVAGSWLRERRLDRKLVGWSAGAAAACLVNPYGWRALTFPLTLATRLDESNPFGESIGEFVSPFALKLSDAFPFQPWLAFGSFYLLVALGVLSLPGLLRQRRLAVVLLVPPFLWLASTAVRNIPPFVLACLPGIACGFVSGLRRYRGGSAVLSRAVAIAVAAGSVLAGARVVSDAHYIDTRRPERFGFGWNREALPVDAVGWAVAAGLDGHVLNSLGYGGYLMWGRPQPVFIDGRLEVVGEAFYDEYRRIFGSEQELEAAVARYGIEWVFFPYRTSPEMLRRLSADPRWRLSYVDHQAAIFARRGSPAERALHPSAVRAGEPPGSSRLEDLPGFAGRPRMTGFARWLAGLTGRREFPSASFGLGLFHYFRGDAPRAAPLFAAAVAQSDGAYYEIYANLGSALFRLGRLADAAACYRIVLEERPDNELARSRLREIAERDSSGRP